MKTPYRSDVDALRDRKATLESELSHLTAQTQGLDALRARQEQLAKELAEVEGRLGAGRRALPMLDQVRVASPCSADWNEMVGDDRVRHCLKCDKSVYNLSSMPREEAETLLQARGELCVRFYQRADGTVMTQDCPVGAKKKRRKLLAIAVAGAGALAATAFTALERGSCRPMTGAVRMGEMVVTPPELPAAPTATTTATANPQPMPMMGAVAVPRATMGKPSIDHGKH